MLVDFSDKYNIDAFDDFVAKVSGWNPSPDELTSIMSLTYDFIFDWFSKFSKRNIEMKKGLTKECETRIGKIMTFINFLSSQKKNCPQAFEKLGVERKIDLLFNVISTTQKELIKNRK